MANYELSNRIYELRTQKGLSQKELGAILGVSNKAVSKWETGTAIPKTETLIKLAEVFEISTEELLNSVCKDENNKLDRKSGNSIVREGATSGIEKSPKEIKKYFFKVSVVFEIILTLMVFLPIAVGFILELVGMIFDNYALIGISEYIVNIVLIWALIVITFGCIKLGKHLTKKSGCLGEFNKHKFLYYVVPRSAISFISTLSTTVLFFGSDYMEDASYWSSRGLNLLLSFISIVLTIFVMTVLMNNSIEQNPEKSRKTFKVIAIIVTVSALAGYVLDGIADYMEFGIYNGLSPIQDFLFLCIDIAIVWLVYSIKESNPKIEKIAFVILPIISLWGPEILKILTKVIRYI